VENMRRNNLDISAEILQVAQAGAKKTQIVYKANLNFLLLKKYMKNLIEKDFVNKNDTHYYTTEKGMDFLRSYQELSSMVRGLA
jgi:predicted transcriptional regulator